MSAKKPLTLFISTVWPEPTSSAAGVRTLQLLECFRKFGHSIALASPSRRTERSFCLENHEGFSQVQEFQIRPNDPEFDLMLSKLSPNVVVFDRFIMEEQFGWRVNEVVPEAFRIVDSQDLHFLRSYRNQLIKSSQKSHEILDDPNLNDVACALCSDAASREIASFIRSDLTLIISAAELQLMEKFSEISMKFNNQLFYLPFMPKPNPKALLPTFSNRSSELVMIGNFMHKPNQDSVYCVKNYYDRNQGAELPTINVFGAYPPPELMKHRMSKKGFVVRGPCDDALSTISKYRVLFAPLRFGAGLKGKLFDALMTRTAFVTSKVGAEGILDLPISRSLTDAGRRLSEICIATTMSEAILKSRLLSRDKDVWNEAVTLGERILTDDFSADYHEKRLKDELDRIIGADISHEESFSRIKYVRNSPGRLIQRVLNHQSVHYPRMLSKYVELKERKSS